MTSTKPTLVIVTDPMCSWCWGMAAQTDRARERFGDRLNFELLLGGVNVQATQRIGRYGERHLYRVWQEVEATTGQPFAYKLPQDTIYNSTLPAMAVRAFSREYDKPAFGYLHHLQKLFFQEGVNINDTNVLCQAASACGWDGAVCRQRLAEPRLQDIVHWEFENARAYGTSALPNLLIDDGQQRRLLVGGYLDCPMLETMLEPWLDNE